VRIKMQRDIPGTILFAGETYEAKMGLDGSVTACCVTGDHVYLQPGEFEVAGWENKTRYSGTD